MLPTAHCCLPCAWIREFCNVKFFVAAFYHSPLGRKMRGARTFSPFTVTEIARQRRRTMTIDVWRRTSISFLGLAVASCRKSKLTAMWYPFHGELVVFIELRKTKCVPAEFLNSDPTDGESAAWGLRPNWTLKCWHEDLPGRTASDTAIGAAFESFCNWSYRAYETPIDAVNEVLTSTTRYWKTQLDVLMRRSSRHFCCSIF